MKDNENDLYSVQADLTEVEAFTKFINNELLFSPSSNHIGSYTITFNMADLNKYPMSSSYSTTVNVLSKDICDKMMFHA